MFREIRIMFRGVPSSLANSSGIFLGGTVLLRHGAAGRRAVTASIRRRASPIRCGRWSSCKARIIQVRTVNERRDRRLWRDLDGRRDRAGIAIVAVGYADGFLRGRRRQAQARRREVIVAGKRCPIAGRVSMDLFAVDVTDLAEGTRAARRIRHPDRRRDERRRVAAGMGTIGYEVLTSLGRRYHRVYKS